MADEGKNLIVVVRLWILYIFSVLSGFLIVPGRLIFGRSAFLLAGPTIAAALWIEFKHEETDWRSSLAFWINLAGVTLGGSVGFFVVGALSDLLFLGRVEPTKMNELGLKWICISVACHGFLYFRSKYQDRRAANDELFTGPPIPQDFDALSEEEKLRFKQDMEVFLDSSMVEIQKLNKEMNRKLIWGLVLVVGGGLLLTWPYWRHLVGL